MVPNKMTDSIDNQLYFNDQELETISFAGISESDVRDAVRILQDWIRQQPHLPECAVSETRLLWRIWLIRKMSLERTKQTVDMYYTVRNLIPELFKNRDPVILQEQQAFKHVHVVPLPVLLDDFTQIINTQFLGIEDGQFDTIKFIKTGIMVADLIFRSTNALGFQMVMDLKNISLGVIMKITPAILKKLQVKAYPLRIKSIHLTNAPDYIDKVVSLLKFALPPKLIKRIVVHKQGFETLHDHIKPKYLPSEYGGELGPTQALWDSWTKDLISKRDWFLEQENISSDEEKRPGKPLDQSEMFGMEGSFKKLSVD
uniref:CRAL-TRIO domain-containing protein n=1 Tax=Timema genevievae TaxID=629358 RepID=A0A7R9K5X2_TIMGE|nr:unnamed protein product [Timema genevievae]